MFQGFRRWQATIMVVTTGVLSAPALALAQEPQEMGRLARLEPGLMLLTTVGILILGGIVFRVLARFRSFSSLAWLLPVLIGLCGILLVAIASSPLRDLHRLEALVRFLLTFFLLVAVLYPVTRLLLPPPGKLTRGGVPPLIRGLVVALIAFVGMFILLTWSFPDLSFTPMFVTSGAVSIVLGLAVQDLLANLLAGVVISFERPFKLGDWVRIGDVEGEVANIAWRATKVRTRTHDYVFVPNTISTKQMLTNYDQPSSLHMLKIHVGVTYGTPCALATLAVEEAAARVPDVLTNPAPVAHFHQYADSSLVYELWAWMENYESVPAVESEIRKEIWYSFKRHGITIPFPQRDVHFYRPSGIPEHAYGRLYVTDGPLRGGLFELGEEPLSIGRHASSGMCIVDPHVSNQHAVIACEDAGYTLRDLDSRHGTRLNGDPVKEAVLRQGDQIVIGSVTLVYEENLGPEGCRSLRPAARISGVPEIAEGSTETRTTATGSDFSPKDTPSQP